MTLPAGSIHFEREKKNIAMHQQVLVVAEI